MPTIMLLLQAVHSAHPYMIPNVLSLVLKVTHMAYLADRHHAHLHAKHHAHTWTHTKSPLKALERGVGKTPRLG
jgi:uncharacterized protein involved in tolerance to divalent cations